MPVRSKVKSLPGCEKKGGGRSIGKGKMPGRPRDQEREYYPDEIKLGGGEMQAPQRQVFSKHTYVRKKGRPINEGG